MYSLKLAALIIALGVTAPAAIAAPDDHAEFWKCAEIKTTPQKTTPQEQQRCFEAGLRWGVAMAERAERIAWCRAAEKQFGFEFLTCNELLRPGK